MKPALYLLAALAWAAGVCAVLEWAKPPAQECRHPVQPEDFRP